MEKSQEIPDPYDPDPYDVAIIGAGLAGLSLARQILLETEGKRILLLERKEEIPGERQKIGEATVQVSGFYFSRVLDLEEHLFREHYMKYNLRFLWKTEGRSNESYEDYSQAYIRPFSNIASYQLDRNKLEAELLRLNLEDERFTFHAGVKPLDVELAEEGPHEITFQAGGNEHHLEATWVVDSSGRARYLAKRLGMGRKNAIRHGSTWFWVEGLLNVEKLTDMSHLENLRNPDRAFTGHLPAWLATNHFMGEGYWLWVIPLQGRTSIGLVYDREAIDREKVARPEPLIDWICEQFPLFGRELRQHEVVDWGGYRDFSYDCADTISPQRWALSGEAGRFSDPLYSPGGDLIALYNTLITAAIEIENPMELTSTAGAYEQMMRAVYEAYVPSYSLSYDVLGDPEAYTLKYTWELTVYFGLYVFPFINGLFTDRRFILMFLSRFSRLGPVNHNIQEVLSAYYQWKKTELEPLEKPVFHDFMSLGPLQKAEKTFYEVGLTVDEARHQLNHQLDNLKELARFIFAWVASRAVGDEKLLTNRGYVESIDLGKFKFDPEEIRQDWSEHSKSQELYEWSFAPCPLKKFRPKEKAQEKAQVNTA